LTHGHVTLRSRRSLLPAVHFRAAAEEAGEVKRTSCYVTAAREEAARMAGEVAGIGALLRPNKYSILKFVEIHPGSSYVRISPLRYRHHASADACCLLADHARRPSRCLRAAIPQEGLQRQAAKSTRMTALWPSTGLSSKVLHVVLCVCVCVHVCLQCVRM